MHCRHTQASTGVRGAWKGGQRKRDNNGCHKPKAQKRSPASWCCTDLMYPAVSDKRTLGTNVWWIQRFQPLSSFPLMTSDSQDAIKAYTV